MAKITFTENGKTIEIENGKTILEAQVLAGLTPDAPCGGKGRCGKCKVTANGQTVLACQTIIKEDLTVSPIIQEEKGVQILMKGIEKSVPFAPGPMPEGVENPLLAAVDIGSTSVVLYLMDGRTGKELGVKSTLNPQRKYGADVVSRCSYAIENGRDKLSSCIRETIDELIAALCGELGKNKEDIVRISMVGNCGMHHLFLELPTETLALAPYTPKVKDALVLKAADYGIHIRPDAELLWLPNIGGFVGADTVGCLVATDLDTTDDLTLMVDIGTNGEMVLGNKDGMLSCSTAAGPAFEGAKITCGMRGSKGAIDHVKLEEDGTITWHVIGDCEPVGICGSGLLDLAACLLDKGLIDDTGRMEETFYFTEKVFLNQKDVRELQLAKAAIAAGILILCENRGVEAADIKKMYIAGAFGNYLDPKSACRIGMIPRVLSDRIISIGNAAGEGAQLAVMNTDEFERSKWLAQHAGFVELAMDPGFQDVYVDELGFDDEEDE